MKRTLARFGEQDIDSNSDGPVQDIRISEPVAHWGFNKQDGTNDIAVLRLERDVTFTS